MTDTSNYGTVLTSRLPLLAGTVRTQKDSWRLQVTYLSPIAYSAAALSLGLVLSHSNYGAFLQPHPQTPLAACYAQKASRRENGLIVKSRKECDARGQMSTSSKMGNGTKFKLSSMFPGVLNKIKGMTGKKVKDKGSLSLNAYGNDWSDDIHDFSISKDFHGNPPSPVRTFSHKVVDKNSRYCSSPPCPSPINIRFPMESPIRRMKSRPVSPPRRSVNSTDSDSPLAVVARDRARRAVPPVVGRSLHRQLHNGFNSDTHSDSELDAAELEAQSARAHLRIRTMSLQLDGVTEWDREREREWSEPELEAYGWSSGRRTRRNGSVMVAGEPSPIHTVRCMPPNTPSEFGNYSSDPRDLDLDHRSACPDFSSRELSIDRSVSLQFPDRKFNVATDDTYNSLSSDDDFFKVQRSRSVIDRNYGLRETNEYSNGDLTTDESEPFVTEDEERRFGRHSALLAKTVRSRRASNSWGRAQSRFAEEKHQNQQQEKKSILSYGRKEFDASDEFVGKEDEEEERHHYHVALSRREASLVKTVLSAKDWARTNLRALNKARELEKQHNGETESMVDYEPFGMRAIRKEEQRHHSRGSSISMSPVGEVEKHTKGRIDYKLGTNDINHRHDSDSSPYEHLSEHPADNEIDFYKNAHTEESDFETNPAAVPRFREIEFPSFRSDRGIGRRGDFVNGLESDRLASRSHRFSIQQDRSSRNPRKQTPSVTSFTTKSGRDISGRKSNRSGSPGVQDVSPVSKPSPRSGSPRRQELHGGKKMSSPREEVLSSKKAGRPPSPKRQEAISSRKASSISSFQGGQQKQQHEEVKSSKKGTGRSESHALARPNKSEKMGTGADITRLVATAHDDRTTVMGSESVAVVKASFDPYQDFRDSMVEMILENDIQTAGDLEELLQCYLSLNSSDYHSIIVQVFSDIWRDIFDH
ncbi:hypothetical protein R1sor_024177 [Riccia sorocarpa]|uniref:OVATE domain-containing protein n=1 Tax=Riccia sorocarpa TaxID=122646 RepID=A0ABD3GTU6_9MARC